MSPHQLLHYTETKQNKRKTQKSNKARFLTSPNQKEFTDVEKNKQMIKSQCAVSGKGNRDTLRESTRK